MKKAILLAVLAVALLTVPAFASVQNIKVSGDVDSTWVVRDQFDLGDVSTGESFYQNFLMTQARLRADADLTDNVQATIGLINERTWGDDTGNTDTTGTVTDSLEGANDVDINLAYVTLREMLYSPLTVIIGRQVFAYGNSFVIDATGSNNSTSTGGLDGVAEDLTKRSAMDAVRMVFDYNPLTVDVVAAKIDANNVGGDGAQDDDIDLFGTNANWQVGDQWNSVVEGYFWTKIDQSTKVGAAGLKADTVYMPGVHVSTTPIKGLNLQVEGALQRGNRATVGSAGDNVIREAAAGQFITNYMLPFEQTAQWSPVVTGVYTYVSGDSGPAESGTLTGDDHYTAWDPMFENQASGTIYNAIFNLTNAHIVTARASLKPIEDVTTNLEWSTMWLDKELSDGDFNGTCTSCFTMNQPDGEGLAVNTSSNSKLGDEVGVGLVYDYTEDVQFGAKASWFRPGGVFDDIPGEQSDIASQYIVNGNVRF